MPSPSNLLPSTPESVFVGRWALPFPKLQYRAQALLLEGQPLASDERQLLLGCDGTVTMTAVVGRASSLAVWVVGGVLGDRGNFGADQCTIYCGSP